MILKQGQTTTSAAYMATSNRFHRGRAPGLVFVLLAVVMAVPLPSCSRDPAEEPVSRLETFLETLESDLNSGNQGKNPALQAQELRNIYDTVLAMDAAGLERQLEDRRTRALGESELYLMVLLDEATRASASPSP